MALESPIISPGKYFKFPETTPYRAEKPMLPLVLKEGNRDGGVDIGNEERELLLDYARWAVDPPFAIRGRSAFVVRQEPLIGENTIVAAYKLKGVGNYDRENRITHPPRPVTYERRMALPGADSFEGNLLAEIPAILIHSGIADNGSLIPMLDKPKPLGGLSHGHAKREFANAVRLYKASVPACSPITWGQYSNLHWEGKPMEFVVLAQPTATPERMGDYFESDVMDRRYVINQIFKHAIEKQFDLYDEKKLGLPAIKIARDMGYNMGKTIRLAHEAGLARFAGQTGNFSYIPEKKAAYLHDFDSSIGLEDVAPRARSITILRDIESALFGIFHSIVHSQIFWILGNTEQFQKNNPIRGLLQGYFHDISGKVLEESREVKTIERIVLQLIAAHGENASYHHQSEWMNIAQDAFLSQIMKQLMLIYRASPLHAQFRLPYGPEEYDAHLQKFIEAKKVMYRVEIEKVLSAKPWLRPFVQVG